MSKKHENEPSIIDEYLLHFNSEDNTEITEEEIGCSDHENISCWLLALNSLDTHFSRIESNRSVSYKVTYNKSNSNNTALDNNINPKKNDLVIGYLSNPSSPKLLKYVFKIIDALNTENNELNSKSKTKANSEINISISFIKLFESSVEIDINSIFNKAPITHSNIISTNEINRLISEIPYNEFKTLVKFMLESVSSNLFNITLESSTDIFDITKNIKNEELVKIKDTQKKLRSEIRNKIVYGAPGTGKSYHINKYLYNTSSSTDAVFENEFLYERITFHPSYTYGQFVGTYKPSPIYSKDNSQEISWYGADGIENNNLMNPHIDYTLVAGPFLNMLCKALNNLDYNFLLIIEEMNRANTAGVFGDVFQLLDRDNDNNSTYSIKFNTDITNFLLKNIKDDVPKHLFNRDTGYIRIPNNLFIWGTMNSADEGVSKMDSAFKRRWSFKYMNINPEKDDYVTKLAMRMPFLDKNDGSDTYIKWNEFRQALNNALEDINSNLPEDKYIGPYFLNENELLNEDIIKSKLLLYLKDDVLRHSSDRLFKFSTFSKISNNFNKENIFKHDYLKDLQDIVIDNADYVNYENLNNITITSNDTGE